MTFNLLIWRLRAYMLRFNLTISAYCWLTVLRNNSISSVMPCNTFDMSVTCFFIGIKVKRKSEIRKKNKHLYSLYTKILEERVQTGQYRWIVTCTLLIHNISYTIIYQGSLDNFSSNETTTSFSLFQLRRNLLLRQ